MACEYFQSFDVMTGKRPRGTLIVSFVAVFLFTCILCTDNDKTKIKNDITPANKWQIVKKGQKLPRGLNVRINYASGSSSEKHKQSVEKLVTSKAATSNAAAVDDEDLGKSETKSFRSYDELKKNFDSLGLTAKTDAELLKELMDKFQQALGEKQAITLLEDLEYLSHQYDNAIEFVNQNGFNGIIYKSLNSSSVAIKCDTLRLLGSLLQNNAKVQIHALETGSVDVLLKILALDPDVSVKNRAVYSLSCLLRRFPLAQKAFLDNAGLEVISRLMRLGDVKLKVKVITFLNDLMVEHEDSLAEKGAIDYLDKKVQYGRVSLKAKLMERGWCVKIAGLLVSVLKVDQNDHDGIEKCLTVVNFLLDECRGSFFEVKNIVTVLQARYHSLISEEGGANDYFEHLYKLCKEIVDDLGAYRNEL